MGIGFHGFRPVKRIAAGKKGYAIALRTGPGMKECDRILDTIEHFYGPLEIACRGRLGLCGVEYREAVAAREKVSRIVADNPYVLQMHGFYLDQAEKTIRFDIVVSFDAKDRKQVYREVCENVQKEYPEYRLQVAMDTDFSEESEA